MAPGKGWFNLESGTSVIPDSTFFEGEPAFKFLNLSRTTRLYGFAGCFIAGFVLSLLGTIFLTFGGLIMFAIFYALGTVVSLVGTGFLIGFFNQLKMMFKPIRVVATVILIASIGLVFVGAFVLNNGVLCLIFVFVEFLAYTWYTLSYIPYARTGIKRMIGFG
ncbi:SFT2-domain-containing protein [Crepidotus variabilis]|uniref:Protein transport protein SFT2 n=1 Tax=Crepidotus variabilis TaxID=179855 RepID=A0A9P6ENH9_9AGAR|nr:SFT2-domain-containing protein [Crepidotus variabilis]